MKITLDMWAAMLQHQTRKINWLTLKRILSSEKLNCTTLTKHFHKRTERIWMYVFFLRNFFPFTTNYRIIHLIICIYFVSFLFIAFSVSFYAFHLFMFLGFFSFRLFSAMWMYQYWIERVNISIKTIMRNLSWFWMGLAYSWQSLICHTIAGNCQRYT